MSFAGRIFLRTFPLNLPELPDNGCVSTTYPQGAYGTPVPPREIKVRSSPAGAHQDLALTKTCTRRRPRGRAQSGRTLRRLGGTLARALLQPRDTSADTATRFARPRTGAGRHRARSGHMAHRSRRFRSADMRRLPRDSRSGSSGSAPSYTRRRPARRNHPSDNRARLQSARSHRRPATTRDGNSSGRRDRRTSPRRNRTDGTVPRHSRGRDRIRSIRRRPRPLERCLSPHKPVKGRRPTRPDDRPGPPRTPLGSGSYSRSRGRERHRRADRARFRRHRGLPWVMDSAAGPHFRHRLRSVPHASKRATQTAGFPERPGASASPGHCRSAPLNPQSGPRARASPGKYRAKPS